MTELSAEMVGRYEHLTQRASKLRGRTVEPSRWLFLVGGGSVSLGLAMVLIGYLGASHTIYVFEQIPYLISGGILGGCFVIAGGFCYFAFWLTRIHAEVAMSRALDLRSADTLERVELLLTKLVEKP